MLAEDEIILKGSGTGKRGFSPRPPRLLVAFLLGCSVPLGAQDPDRDVTEVPQYVIDAAASLVQRAPEIDLVWPGFWPRPRPYVLIDFQHLAGSLLFTSDDPLDGYSLVPQHELPPPLHGRLYAHAGPFDADYLAGARTVPNEATPVPAPLTGPDGLDNGYSQAEAILHESFHFWQLARWNDRHRRQPADCTPQRFAAIGVEPPARFQEAARRELEMLARAVDATDREQLLGRVLEYLTVRQERLTAVDPLFAAVEQRQERREGSAQFAGLAGSLAATHEDATHARAALKDSLAVLLRGFRSFADERQLDADQEAAFRVYYTGAAIAFLLDVLDAGSWRAAVERGEFLDVLLADAVSARDYVRIMEARATYRPCTAGDRGSDGSVRRNSRMSMATCSGHSQFGQCPISR